MGYFANRPGATEASTSLAIAARDVVFAPSPSPNDGSISERVKKFLVTRQPLSSLCMATAPFVQPDGTTTIVYAIYGRHSKDGSNPKSTEDQVAECRADLLARGIEVPDDRVYMDPNIPGRYFNKREALQRMRVDAKAKKFNRVLIDLTSRLGRDLPKIMKLYAELLSEGVELEARGLGVLSLPIFTLLGLLAQLENEEKSRAVIRGKKRAVDRGDSFSGGVAPYGYKLGPRDENDKATFVKDDKEAEKLILIFEMCAAGVAVGTIASLLNIADVPAPMGGKWSAPSLWSSNFPELGILRNLKYLGQTYIGKTKSVFNSERETRGARLQPVTAWTVKDARHHGIVPAKLFFAVQEKLDALMEKRAAARKNGEPISSARPGSLLSSLIRCCSCRGPLWIVGATAKGKPRLQCSNSMKIAGVEGSCKNTSTFCCESIEKATIEILFEVFSHQNILNDYIDAYERERKNAAKLQISQRDELIEKRAKVQKRIERLVDALLDNILPESVIKTRNEEFQAELKRLDVLLTGVPDSEPMVVNAPSLERMRETLKLLATDTKGLADTVDGSKLIADFRSLVAAVVPIRPVPLKRSYKVEVYGCLALLAGHGTTQDPITVICKSKNTAQLRSSDRLTFENGSGGNQASYADVCFVAEGIVKPGQSDRVSNIEVNGLVSLYDGYHVK